MLDRTEDTVPGGDLAASAPYDDYLQDVTFPISKTDMITHLREVGVDDSIIAHVESLTGDTFEHPDDVFSGIFPH